MREHRIYTAQPLAQGERIMLESGAARHLIQVLRLKTGSRCTLFNGDGHDYAAQITRAEKRVTEIEILERSTIEDLPPLHISLGIGISKGERMDFAIQKSVELGVTAITPLLTERCIVRLPPERLHKRLAHWRQVSIAACEQSGRRRLPDIEETQNLSEWLLRHTGEPGLLLDHRAQANMQQIPAPAKKINLLIGPEGGLSKVERNTAIQSGFRAVRLGPRVLRTETAPLAAITAIQLLWGDLN